MISQGKHKSQGDTSYDDNVAKLKGYLEKSPTRKTPMGALADAPEDLLQTLFMFRMTEEGVFVLQCASFEGCVFHLIPVHYFSFHFVPSQCVISMHFHLTPFHRNSCHLFPFHSMSFHIPFPFMTFPSMTFPCMTCWIQFFSCSFHVVWLLFFTFYFHVHLHFHFISSNSIQFHVMPFHFFHSLAFHVISFHSMSFMSIHVTSFLSISFHAVSFPSLSFPCIPFHSISVG